MESANALLHPMSDQMYQAKKIKLHSPSDENHSWSHDEAVGLLESHPADKKINWSDYARKIKIPGDALINF